MKFMGCNYDNELIEKLIKLLRGVNHILDDVSTVKEMLGNIQTLLTQVNQKLNEHTSE